MPLANTADIHFHSLWQASTPQRQNKPILFFSLAKNFIQDLWLFRCSSCFSLVKKTIWPIRICAVYYKSFSFFHIYHGLNLCLYTMYDKPTYIHTHYKKFGPGKPFTVSKYTTKISSPTTTSVGDHRHICIKLKTGQVDKSYM